jgi:hypothetical protein
MLGEPSRAQDAVQDAFLVAFRNLGSLRAPEAFGAWLRQRVVVKQAGRVGGSVSTRIFAQARRLLRRTLPMPQSDGTTCGESFGQLMNCPMVSAKQPSSIT